MREKRWPALSAWSSLPTKSQAFPADGDPAQLALGAVVVEAEAAVVEEAHERVLLADGRSRGRERARPRWSLTRSYSASAQAKKASRCGRRC